MTSSELSFTSSGYLITEAIFSLPSVTFSRESTRNKKATPEVSDL